MTEPGSPWRPEFLKALELLAHASEAMHARGLPRPILVGGGAAEYYSASALMTGDIDVTSPVQPELEEELRRLGFVRPSGSGRSLRGWVYPDLGLGFEVVGSSPLDGAVDPARLVLVEQMQEGAAFVIIPVEDLIADRMGQYASGSAPEMLEQARRLLALHPDADMHYLERRIRTETLGEHGVDDIRRED
ncbi:MAG: hypothetical protein JOZ90_11515 [Alphaproteobacteria bacterium]|nr:hypothetical protein [Alphaproteobacteria bacterium]MBV9372012.1 hypothetical protein [Alphaproteobacteria bacterium]MBV9901714.1 hypothetical protein [Alphaproteobacteria bacterium]